MIVFSGRQVFRESLQMDLYLYSITSMRPLVSSGIAALSNLISRLC